MHGGVPVADAGLPEVRDPGRTVFHVSDRTVYDCGDDGLFCELETINGITTCLFCGDRPYVRWLQ
jgi:hypothetical protein